MYPLLLLTLSVAEILKHFSAMDKTLLISILFHLACCSGPSTKSPAPGTRKPVAEAPAAEPAYKWTQLTENAAFPKSYNFQLFSIRDTLWALHHAGTWFSTDGEQWTKSPLANIIRNNAFLDYVWFKDALYCIGTFEGNIERYQLTSAIHRTSDMKHWKTIARESNLPKRFFYHPFVFKDKLWIIGGNDGSSTFSDVWNSADGVKWVKQADHLPFGNREHSQFIVFQGKIFLLNNDVWASDDGINWSKVTDRLAQEDIFGYASIVYDNQIWLIGCNRDGIFQSQVLVSKDGKNWETRQAPWTPRGAATACIHQGKIFMTGGKYGGLAKDGRTTEFVYSNDVWTLEKQ
jgi:hypothetical protein